MCDVCYYVYCTRREAENDNKRKHKASSERLALHEDEDKEEGAHEQNHRNCRHCLSSLKPCYIIHMLHTIHIT